MARRTPGAQARSQYHAYWGIYPTPTDLPNTPGGVPPFISLNLLVDLEPGDTAFTTSDGPYYCVSVGTPGLGDAVWLQVAAPIVSIAGARRDHSVNGALVDGLYTSTPILRTKTDQHTAGAYAGGGTGNKAILGSRVAAPVLLSALVSIEFTVEFLTPEQLPLAVNTTPYMNLVVELDPAGAPGVYTIFVFGDVLNPLNQGTYSVPGPDQHKCVWTPGGGNDVLVVNMRGMSTFLAIAPFTCTANLVLPSQGPAPVIGVTLANTWQSRAYSIAGIVAVYPAARIVNAYSGDGGLPKSPNITAGLLLIAGSSANTLQNAVRVLDWRLNGASI